MRQQITGAGRCSLDGGKTKCPHVTQALHGRKYKATLPAAVGNVGGYGRCEPCVEATATEEHPAGEPMVLVTAAELMGDNKFARQCLAELLKNLGRRYESFKSHRQAAPKNGSLDALGLGGQVAELEHCISEIELLAMEVQASDDDPELDID